MNQSQIRDRESVGSFQIALLAFTIVLLAGLVADTLMLLPKEMSDLLHMIDTFGCALFFGDFCYRFYRAESKLAFMKWGWIDLIACIPNLEILRWGRLVRVLRVIRLLRGVRSVQMLVKAVFADKLQGSAVSLVCSAVLLVAFASGSILVFERQPEANIKSAEDAVWWSIATITTVGYGDRYPLTTEGRVIGLILMLAGVSMFACITGIAASFFLGSQQSKPSETDRVLARLDDLNTKVEALASRLGDKKKLDEPLGK